jgi:hypothetical protein
MIDTHVSLSMELYQAIEQQAQMHGCSVNSEISSILADSLKLPQDGLIEELNAWEAASDEDWLKMESILASEAKV